MKIWAILVLCAIGYALSIPAPHVETEREARLTRTSIEYFVTSLDFD